MRPYFVKTLCKFPVNTGMVPGDQHFGQLLPISEEIDATRQSPNDQRNTEVTAVFFAEIRFGCVKDSFAVVRLVAVSAG